MNLYKDKHIFIPLFLAFGAVVAWRAWQDMHPPPQPTKDFFETYYLVPDDTVMGKFTADPDDQRPLVVAAGDITTAKDGSLSFHASPVTPISLPQREIIPLFTLDAWPKSDSALADILAKNAGKWRDLGDLINDIFIEGPRDTKSLETMLEEVNGLRKDLHEEYWLGFFVGRKALDAVPDLQTKLAEADKSLRTIILETKEAQKPGEQLEDTIKKLDKNEASFVLQIDQLPDYGQLQQKMKPDEPERFVGFLTDGKNATAPQKP